MVVRQSRASTSEALVQGVPGVITRMLLLLSSLSDAVLCWTNTRPMNTAASVRASTPSPVTEIPSTIPQERLGNNGAVSSTAGLTQHALAVPLERQNASFGSFDFLKLLETGPTGIFLRSALWCIVFFTEGPLMVIRIVWVVDGKARTTYLPHGCL